ncbi:MULTISPECIES: serine hydrolase [unclassified Pseudonocardia]|uniref:serine hydrolase n=1 Tax=unclassified Pseudonocardia TaxID=2619320 RepID=UPI00111518D1|nr:MULTISPECIES: serine hydrolase [unclassified Pseudonocardia]
MTSTRGPRAGSVSVLLPVVCALLAAGCSAAPARSSDGPCPPVDSDVGTVDGWLGYVAAHPEDVALVADDGRGTSLAHRSEAVHPMASASEALNMVAYARAVARGVVSPDEPVRVGDWERWAVRGSGEDAHAKALDHMGIPRQGFRARDPDQTVTLDQVVEQMMIWSDNAAPDFLRDRLGDRALTDAAEAVGWRDGELPSTTGLTVLFFAPELMPSSTDRAARRAVEWQLARRYASEPAFRADVDSRPVPAGVDEPAFVDGGPGGTAGQLAALWSAVGHGTFEGADIARRLTEQDPDPGPGLIGVGVKGGSTPGVLARGTEVRRDDGTVGVAVLLVRRMSPENTAAVARSSQAFSDVAQAMAQDPALLEQLRCRLPQP